MVCRRRLTTVFKRDRTARYSASASTSAPIRERTIVWPIRLLHDQLSVGMLNEYGCYLGARDAKANPRAPAC